MLRSEPASDPKDPPIIKHEFRDGATFAQATELYVFDKNLRMLMLDAIERIEVTLKVKIAQILGNRDPLAHLHIAQLDGKFTRTINGGPSKHDEWISRFRKREDQSREEFVTVFRNNHVGHEMPIWMAIEVWDFGALSHFIAGMRTADQEALGKLFNVPRGELLTSWIRGINTVRNTCAHHGRLWNRPIASVPKFPKIGEDALLNHLSADRQAQTRIYGISAVIQFLARSIHPQSSWSDRLKAHLGTFPTGPNLSLTNGAGFPADWDQLDLWN